MGLPSELISQFVEVTKQDTTKTESTMYGTTVEYNGSIWVKLDGSDLLTPVSTTADMKPNERVTVMIKNHTATVTGNISSPAARTHDVQEIGSKIDEFEVIVADKVDTKELNAQIARIDELRAENVTIKGTLEANSADIHELEADNVTINEKLVANEADISTLKTNKLDASEAKITYATISDLKATNADIEDLTADYADFHVATADRLKAIDATIDELDATYATIAVLEAEYATIKQLEAEQARIAYLEATSLTADSAVIQTLQADVADIDTLIFGSASGTTIHTSFANAVIAQLGDAQIKSAMIENISASKIAAGDIITNNVRVMSQDGSLIISDETIQISDEARVRVQIGKDASNDYSINIWDADGNLMFSEGGITDKAIKDAIIRNDMVASDANIAASKLDINSLFEEINDSEKTIDSGRIYMDAEKQTLDVVFQTMTSDINDLESDISSQGTSLSVIQGQISSKIWQQDIDNAKNELDEDITTLSTKYSAIEQDVDSISAIVASHTTQISDKADSSTVTSVSNRVSKVESDLDGISTTVSDHTTQISDKADNSTVTEISERVTSLDTDLTGFKTTVSDTYATKTALDTTDAKADALAERVTKTETDIAQTSEQIGLLATKKEVEQTLDGYYTIDETDAAITLKANEINSTVEEKFTELQIGGRNLWENGVFENAVPVGKIDAWDYFEIVDIEGDNPTGHTKAMHFYNGNGRVLTKRFAAADAELVGRTVTMQCWIKYENVVAGEGYWNVLNLGKMSLTYTLEDGTTTTTEYPAIVSNGLSGTSDGWVHLERSYTFRDDVAAVSLGYLWIGLEAAASGEAWVTGIKLEFGNKATDWTPAPEDMASVNDLASYATKTEVKQTADSITSTVTEKINNIEIGGRNYILHGKGDLQEGFFADFDSVDGEYGEVSFSSNGNYDNITLVDGFILGCRDYEVGKEVVFSYDIIFTEWDFPDGASIGEWWMGQRYTNSSDSSITEGAWTYVTAHGLPRVGRDCELNEWLHVEKKLVIPAQAAEGIGTNANIQFYNPNTSATAKITLRLKNVKLEYGNKATDWTPAPEDTDEAINALNATIAEKSTSVLQDAEKIILTALENYAETGDLNELRQEVETKLKVMGDEISMNFTTTTEQINGVDGDLQSFLTTFTKFIKFTSETAITIGSGDSAITLEIDNATGIVFKKNGVQFGWWDGTDFHTGNIVVEVLQRAQFGNFAFIPRTDGSLMLLKVGG